jgi:DNA-binding NtrC family response regulator
MYLRDDHPEPPLPADESGESPCRLNLLLSCGGWREEEAVDQLPRLLRPLGIRSIRVESGEEAADVLRAGPVHIAVVDLAIPLRRGRATPAGGARILTLLRRLEEPPPTVVVRPPQPTTRESVRTLSAALREGAFAVVDRPMHVEAMLEIMRRILCRHYRNVWPPHTSS